MDSDDSDEIFKGDKVEGTECFERAILPKKTLREKLAKLIESDFSKANITSTIKLFQTHSENECVEAVIGILEYVRREKEIPKIYRILLKEIRKDSPVSSWLTSYSQSDTTLFLSFLTGECDIFSDIEKVKKLTYAFPYVARMVSDMLTFHSSSFLPSHLAKFMLSLLKFRDVFDQKAEKRALKRTKPKANHKSALVEVFPNNPEHTVENTYAADLQEDKTEDRSCSKAYNSKFDITGGLTHISCEHNVVKGFTALFKGESALKVLGPVVRRLPARVQAKERFFIYDNSCASHKSALRRFPHRVRHWTFLIDRTHFKNHTTCHNGYNMDE